MVEFIVGFVLGGVAGMWLKNQLNEDKNPLTTIGQSLIIAKDKIVNLSKYIAMKTKKTKNIKSVDEGPNIGVGS